MDPIFTSISLIMIVTIIVAFLARLLRQPLIIAYIAAGILVGPLFLNLLNRSQEYFHAFAQFGVIFLLFIVGLNLDFHFLRKIGKTAAVTGIGQVVFTAVFGNAMLLAMGFGREFSVYISIALTFSSTIIIMKLLDEKRETESVYGRYTIGLMLVQDIIAILLLIFLPVFKSGESLAISLVLMLLKSFFFAALVLFLSRAVLRLAKHAAKSGEFLMLFTIAWCLGIAGLAEYAGLSSEIGAIIAGITLGSSSYQFEISSRLRPLRDFFIVIFFIILGSEIDLGNIGAIIAPGIILSLFVLIGNPLILYILYRLLKFSRKVSFKAGLTAAQVSEFGFVFLFLAREQGYQSDYLLPLFTFVALATIFCSSYLIIYNRQIFAAADKLLRLFGADKHFDSEQIPQEYDAVVFGYHRLGWKICDSLSDIGMKYLVVDMDPAAVKKLQERRIPSVFGDATDVELLSDLPLLRAKLIISTLPNTSSQLTMVKFIREKHPDAVIIASLAYSRFVDELYAAGADYVIMPHLLAGEWMSDVLRGKKISRGLMRSYAARQKEQLKLRHNLPIKRENE